MQCNTMHFNARSRTNPNNPGNSYISGTDTRRYLREPRLGVASASGSLSQTEAGRKEERVVKREEIEAMIQAEGRNM